MKSATLFRDLAVLTGSLSASLILTPVARRIAVRAGLVDRPAPRKFHREPTPYLGGLAVALVVLVSIALETAAHPNLRGRILAFGAGATLVGATGLIDDWRSLGVRPRVAVQAAAAMLLWLAGIRLTPSGFAPIDLAVTIFVVVLVTNSVNLLDNMDGLAAGTVAIAAICYFFMAERQGQELIAPLALSVAGACIGFLRYNFPPARIFLGDAGSLLLGFCAATLLIEVNLPSHPLPTRVAAQALVLAVPLFDTILVVVSRRRGGRPVLQGGTDHLSHRLTRLGLTPRGTAVAIYVAGAACGGLALALLRPKGSLPSIAVLVALAGAVPILIGALERDPTHPSETSRIANTPSRARDTLRGRLS